MFYQRDEAELNEKKIIFHRMKIIVPLHEWKTLIILFYITFTKIHIFKQIQRKKY